METIEWIHLTSIIVPLITAGVTIGFYIAKTNLIIHRIEELEKKQEKYNRLQERIIYLEAMIGKKRINK